ncbi:MAG: D-glycero-beta-D-manno-heptose 1-phosphate adenylyltransferase [Candidatus Stygibacter australis]|nr:D-glycero-beta-D-manno-heptose 1-phosphate adenylyltransferase [Candidatus Stygibacter australis]MDP8321882.1 D-glycero-beta-D-manno-heptose 1-phosphate adenylyltransferase [Candidatus Stygibacter australis]
MRNKLRTWREISAIREELVSDDKKAVFTNGCFDILHRGHVQYLQAARELGDVLIVGLNNDDSVRRLKGVNRPVNSEIDRAIVLSALQDVDHVVIFTEDTPYKLINTVKPDILVKGGDWKPEDIVGSDIVLQSGGEVLSLDFIKGYSTTKTIEEMEKK